MSRNRRHTAQGSRFPDPRLADPDGLVAVGGRLDPDWLLDAYRHGVFPWPTDDDEPLLWWSPDPRALLPLDGMRIARRLRRRLRGGTFALTCNTDFAGVLHGCATAQRRASGTWLTPAMRAAYREMHKLGHCHSVEAWTVSAEGERRLAGGVYGMAIGGAFAAESMFHYETDASKVALATLVAHLQRRGFGMLDIQQWTEHTGRLGAVEVSRVDFLDRLAVLLEAPATFGDALAVGPEDW